MDYNAHYVQKYKIHLESILKSFYIINYLFCSTPTKLPEHDIVMKYAIKLSINGLSKPKAVKLGERFTLFLEGPGKYLVFILIPNNCIEPISFLEYEVHCRLLWKN